MHPQAIGQQGDGAALLFLQTERSFQLGTVPALLAYPAQIGQRPPLAIDLGLHAAAGQGLKLLCFGKVLPHFFLQTLCNGTRDRVVRA